MTPGAASAVSRAAGKLAKGTARLAGRAAGKAARAAAKQAARGIQKLIAMGPPGWAILAGVVLMLGFAVLIGTLATVTFVDSFHEQQADFEDAVDTSTRALHITQSRPASVGESMEVSRRTHQEPGDTFWHPDSANLYRDPVSSPARTHGGVRLLSAHGLDEAVDADEVIDMAITDNGLRALVEWMLPQWLRPYPVMIAGDHVGVATEDDIRCGWPDPATQTWAAPPHITNADTGAEYAWNDLTIVAPWESGTQNVCHLLAAADMLWQAWPRIFGAEQALNPNGSLNLAAAQNAYFGDLPPDIAFRLGTDGDDRFWQWLTFGVATRHDEFPASGHFDCPIIDTNDVDEIEWHKLGLFAENLGHNAHDEVAIPERSLPPRANPGDVMVLWQCPRIVVGLNELEHTYGFWFPVTWAGVTDRATSDRYRSAAPMGTYPLLGIEKALHDLWSVPEEAQVVAVMTQDALHQVWDVKIPQALEEQLGDRLDLYRSDFLRVPEEWSSNASTAWCGTEVRWAFFAEPRLDGYPKLLDAQPQLETEAAQILDLLSRLGAQRVSAESYTIMDPPLPSMPPQPSIEIPAEITSDPDAISQYVQDRLGAWQAEVAAELAEWRAQVDAEKRRASQEIAVIVEGLRDLEAIARDELNYATDRLDLPPWWPHACEHDSLDEAISDARAHFGTGAPDEGSLLGLLFTTHGQGRAFATLHDMSGTDPAISAALRAAAHLGALPRDWRSATWPRACVEAGTASQRSPADAWLNRECEFERGKTAIGVDATRIPEEWAEPRLGLRCPRVDWHDADTLYDDLAWAAAHWDAGDMISVPRFSAVHPCLGSAMRALSWLADSTGIDIVGHGHRSFEASAALLRNRREDGPPVASPGKSRHNYGLAVDFSWKPPEDWLPSEIVEEQRRFAATLDQDSSTPSETFVGTDNYRVCGTEMSNGSSGAYRVLLPVSRFGDSGYQPRRTSDPIMAWNWCWQFLDLMTSLADHSLVPLHWLNTESEVWHWSYDGR